MVSEPLEEIMGKLLEEHPAATSHNISLVTLFLEGISKCSFSLSAFFLCYISRNFIFNQD
jgi:hypothetical protein